MTKPLVDEAAVEHLARAAGIEIPAERRAMVAERLNEMHAMAAEFESVPYQAFEPASIFMADWPMPVEVQLEDEAGGLR